MELEKVEVDFSVAVVCVFAAYCTSSQHTEAKDAIRMSKIYRGCIGYEIRGRSDHFFESSSFANSMIMQSVSNFTKILKIAIDLLVLEKFCSPNFSVRAPLAKFGLGLAYQTFSHE